MKPVKIPGRRKIRFVVLESPYDTLDSKLTQELFSQVIALKIRGYRSRGYSYGVLPADSTDYVATHLIVCQELREKLTPIFSQRSLSLKRCQTHHFDFPLLTTTRAYQAINHEKAVQKVIKRCVRDQVKLCYESSMTIEPSITNEPDLMSVVRGLILVGPLFYHESIGTQELLGLAALKYKADRIFNRWGYKPLLLNGQELDPLTVPSFDNAVAKMYYMRNGFSPELTAYSKNLQGYWDNRILIPGKLEEESRKQKKTKV